MLARDQRTPFSDWWWTVDKLLLGAIMALMLGGVILSLAASPPVATRIGLDPFHFFGRHVLFLLPSLMVLIGVSFLSPKQIRVITSISERQQERLVERGQFPEPIQLYEGGRRKAFRNRP